MAVLEGRPAQPGEGAIIFTKRQETDEAFVFVGGQANRVAGDGPPVIYLIDEEVVSETVFYLAKLAAMEAQASRCRSCRAPIFWRRLYTNLAGPKHPINVIPDRGGNLVLVDRASYRVIPPNELKQIRPAGQIRYTSHFQTCPDRAQWRGANHGTHAHQ